ncbi:hypothetical protein [Rathayibacter rathayi]|uniref:DNA polymerase helix-hairpin-helix motif domain-containing protein n=1 Tax=Rathayibacter rathayi TaxID=33887 RepID=A0ABX5AEX1_RATRA|nr:hypothetical protein [Rathayibacter rathayi]PPF24265.1 hypothetical protein C5C34_05910 [Rathayibacter rathayi]PPF51586.1 hypothetical protein C5C08_01900 [Rathayibacter rathayi]PPF83177.1 hypothetical protein C5C14_01940 [Rathayibacter rathayi]PPG47007.1 hypothetical protein C5C20_01895 [Rathayibacter rathayi]PPG96532.1 hypothetical protein C5C22_02630 [Rathayibacter rathayi]
MFSAASSLTGRACPASPVSFALAPSSAASPQRSSTGPGRSSGGFGSFGFAKAHGAAFALPTYQSAWLKRHHPAEFMAGLLTHDPGMWPKELIVAEAHHLGVPLLPIDVQVSSLEYIVEPTGSGTCYGVRMSLEDLVGSSAAERARIAAHQPFSSLQDFRDRVRPRRATVDSLVRVDALDSFINYEPARRHELLAHLSSVRTTANQISPGARGVSVTGDQAWGLLDVQRAHKERGATPAQVTPLRRKAN